MVHRHPELGAEREPRREPNAGASPCPTPSITRGARLGSGQHRRRSGRPALDHPVGRYRYHLFAVEAQRGRVPSWREAGRGARPASRRCSSGAATPVTASRRFGARRFRCATCPSTSCGASPNAAGCSDLPNVGDTTATVIAEALAGETPQYLAEAASKTSPRPGSDAGNALRAALSGDLHVHSDWSDGGDTIRTMAEQGARPRSRVLRAHRPFAAAEDRERPLARAAARAARRASRSSTRARSRSASSPASRSTSSTTAHSTRTRSCSREIDVVVASVHSKLRMDKAR